MSDIHYPKGESGKRTLCGTLWLDWPNLTSDFSEVTCKRRAGIIEYAFDYGQIRMTKDEAEHIFAITHPEEVEDE